MALARNKTKRHKRRLHPRGSVGESINHAGFDLESQRCVCLQDLPELQMSDWTNETLANLIWEILVRNHVPWKGKRILSRWVKKFVECALTWKEILETCTYATPFELLSQLTSAFPQALPMGFEMTVDQWSRAHVPSVLVALYRGIPSEHRSEQGEPTLLKAWQKHVILKLEEERKLRNQTNTPHQQQLIQDLDDFTTIHWILQPEPLTEKEIKQLDPKNVICAMREFLFNHPLYIAACKDSHNGLMANLAGRWFCDYYHFLGTNGYFTGNDYARYVADVLNPYHLLSVAHRKTFVKNGLDLREKYQRFVDPVIFFEKCMAEPATDVACESTFTMLYIKIIEAGKPFDGNEIKLEDVPHEQLDCIPNEMKARKKLFRFNDKLLREWFHVCKHISNCVAQIYQQHDSDGNKLSRCDIFPKLLCKLGFQKKERRELESSVSRFYHDLHDLRWKTKYLPQLDSHVWCPTLSYFLIQVVNMFVCLQELCIITQGKKMDTGQRGTSSNEADVIPEDDMYTRFHCWFDPQRLLESSEFCEILKETWPQNDIVYSDLTDWKSCYNALKSEDAHRQQRAVISLAIALANFVTGKCLQKCLVGQQDISNLADWINANCPSRNVLFVNKTGSKLKVRVDKKIKVIDNDAACTSSNKKKRKTRDDDPQHQRELEARKTRSLLLQHKMRDQANCLVNMQVRALHVQAVSSRGVATKAGCQFEGKHALPQEIIGKFIGKQGSHIAMLKRELNLKQLIVNTDKPDDCYVHMVAADQCGLSHAQKKIAGICIQLLSC